MEHVIITGGSSGIGEAFARLHLQRGRAATLISRSQDRLSAAANRLAAMDEDAAGRINLIVADVCDADSFAAAISNAEARYGPCHLLITSAGAVRPGYFHELAIDDFESQIRLNYLGTVNAVRAVYAGMRQRGRGQILMISSAAGFIGIAGYTAYSGSKFALTGFAEALRAEARRAGVTVSICYPPNTDTPQLASEHLLKPAETRRISQMAGLLSADAIATIATDGMEKGRFAIYPGVRTGFLGRLISLIRPAVHSWLDYKIRR